MKIRDLTFDEARLCYLQTVREMAITKAVPLEYVELAAECVRVCTNKLCEKNGLELTPDDES